MHVCMFELPDVYVCMSLNFHKNVRVQKHTGKGSPGAFLFIFLLNCEGGYFWKPRWGANVYVCMHVCMFEFPDVYVCMSQNFHKRLRV